MQLQDDMGGGHDSLREAQPTKDKTEELDIWKHSDLAKLDMCAFPVKMGTILELRKINLIGPHRNDDQRWRTYLISFL